MPAGGHYRRVTETLARSRLAAIRNTDAAGVEEAIGEGPLDELIKRVEEDLEAIPKIIAANPFAAEDVPKPAHYWEPERKDYQDYLELKAKLEKEEKEWIQKP